MIRDNETGADSFHGQDGGTKRVQPAINKVSSFKFRVSGEKTSRDKGSGVPVPGFLI